MTEHLSRKLRALSFFAIILVVFVHSYNAKVKFTLGQLSDVTSTSVMYLENFLSKGLCRVAIPLFFLISGFLFCLRLHFSTAGVIDKYKKRVKSLLIPYLFWSISGVFLFLFLQAFPFSRIFFTHGLIVDYSFSKLIHTIILDPILYQFWFIRDLILLVLFSPFIVFLTTVTQGLWILILVFLWYLTPNTLLSFSNESLVFFSMGCYLALNKSEHLFIPKPTKRLWPYLMVSWLLIVSATSYYLTFSPNGNIINFLDHTGVFVGILSLWYSYDSLFRYEGDSTLFDYTFVIFALHEPLLTIIVKGLFYLWGKTNASALLIYLLAPVLTILICFFCGSVWKKQFPGFYHFATGGR